MLRERLNWKDFCYLFDFQGGLKVDISIRRENAVSGGGPLQPPGPPPHLYEDKPVRFVSKCKIGVLFYKGSTARLPERGSRDV